MKKRLLLVALGGLFCGMTAFAQEEDVTHYIQNAGFDTDLTWQVDGASKTIIDKSTTLSNRTIAGEAEDGSLYATVNPSTPNKRGDGRTMEATNGFIGAISGWETAMPSNKGCEWVYFGTLPYALGETAVPVADDGSTYLTVPAKPADYDTEDNVGFLYLRAGWGGGRTYKQVVKLPCAVYRLEYWTININPNSTATATDQSKITCRKEVFKDETGTGLSAQEWTKHEFEFTPTSEFTMEFGFTSANAGSGANPIVCLDGIKLYKIGEADPIQLLKSDFNDAVAVCSELASQAAGRKYIGLSSQISDYELEIEDMITDEQASMEANLVKINAQIEVFRQALAKMDGVDAILQKMDNLLQTTNYDGKAAFEAAYQKILGYKENEPKEGEDVGALLNGAEDEAIEAIKTYYLTQKATVDQPADFTIFIKHPWFIETAAEPVEEDGEWVFPKNTQDEETGEYRYKEGSGSSPDLTSDGWVINGAGGGDQRLNWQRGRSCWNAWNNNFTTTLSVGQTIEGLPNGYYTVSADLITESGYANGSQRVYAQSIAEKKTSTAALTSDGWDYNEWETVAMTADDKVLVVDGKLTIGAQGTGDGSGASGWFLATNFHLNYLGEAPADAAQKAFEARIEDAKAEAEAIPFAGDKKAMNDSIAKYSAVSDVIEGLTGLSAAMDFAQTSINKYEEQIPSDGTVDGKTLPTVENTLKKNGGEGYDAAEEIMEFAYNFVMNWVKNDTASYKYFDATVDLLKNYLNTYTPAYNEAAEAANAASAAGKEALTAVMNEQKAALTSEMKDKETIDAYVEKLKDVALTVIKQNIVDDANETDYTGFIRNPKLESEAGWEFVKGNGDANSKSGQWYDGSDTRYIDSYNGGGLQGYIASQLITNLPNGTYTVGAYTRTPAEGAYLFTALGTDTTYVEIPLDYYQTVTEAGEDTTVVASDTHGPIWEAARDAYENGDYTDEQYNIYMTNVIEGEPVGRGWKHQEITGIVVTNHELLIGTAAGSEALKTEKVFKGAWYSVGGWTLTLTAKGDNTGWEGPIASGIKDAKTIVKPTGIYTPSGVKIAKLQRGLNIIVSGDKAQKVMVK